MPQTTVQFGTMDSEDNAPPPSTAQKSKIMMCRHMCQPVESKGVYMGKERLCTAVAL